MLDWHPEAIRPRFMRPGPNGPEPTGTAADLLRAFKVIEQVEFGPPKALREYQQQCVAGLLGHARRYSPFWAARIPAGRTVLRGLPVLRRQELRAQAAAEGPLPIPAEHGEVQQNQTSGSSGEPLRFYGSALNGFYNEARAAFDDLASGRDIAQPMTVMTIKYDQKIVRDGWPNVIGDVWQTGPGTILPFPNMTVEEIVEMVYGQPVGHFTTRPSVIAALAAHALRTGQRPEMLGDILSFGDTVSPEMRDLVQRALGKPVWDRYSCEEVGPLAFQCPRHHTHYHVTSSNALFEAVDDRGRPVPEGKLGNLLVTGLNTLATPIIRYALQDMAVLLPRCPCGHQGQAMTNLQGRRRSLLSLPDGRRKYYHVRCVDLVARGNIREARLTQTELKTLVLELVVDTPMLPENRDELITKIKADTSPDFDIRIEEVPAIDWGGSTKRIPIRNLLEEQPV